MKMGTSTNGTIGIYHHQCWCSKMMMVLWVLVATTSTITKVVEATQRSEEVCVSETNTFTARVDLYGGELGNYVFEECGLDILNPTIAMEIGETYTFVQEHRTNYYHPFGFAYSPYGDEELKLTVAPGISRGNQDCVESLTCPAPMYFLNDEYLGKYSNIPSIKNVTTGEDEIGYDSYTPLFLRNPHEWTNFGTFSVKLRIDDDQIVDNDLFYFCHIHEFMGGRIKLTKNGVPLNDLDSPSLGYEYDQPGEFDKKCGTYGLADFQLPGNPFCPTQFVCAAEEKDQGLKDFAACIDATNCHMFSGMTTGIKAESEAALFIHQMIPHHQNAVNMAKALLKTQKLQCNDLGNEDDQDCILEGILFEIVNNQNLQIQAMYDYLDAKRLPSKDNCNVYVETISEVAFLEKEGMSSASNFGGRGTSSAYLFGIVMTGFAVVVSLQHLFMG